MNVSFVPVTDNKLEEYIAIGVRSYHEHYLHLWKNGDPSPFIQAHLTKQAVRNALKNPLELLYIISFEGTHVDILHITHNVQKVQIIPKKNLLLNKIYLLQASSRKGIGSATMKFVHDLAKKGNKNVVWLYAMKKGKTVDFYKRHGYTIIREAILDLPDVIPTEKEMWIMARKP